MCNLNLLGSGGGGYFIFLFCFVNGGLVCSTCLLPHCHIMLVVCNIFVMHILHSFVIGSSEFLVLTVIQRTFWKCNF